jgi:hypothetical protein
MPVDRNAPLSQKAKELVRKRIDELSEELKTKFDPGFRPGVHIPYTDDREGLPDGLWVGFPQNTSVEMAYSLIEADHATLQNFMKDGLREKLESLRKTSQSGSQPPDGNLY